MSFSSVYKSLQELFPQVDRRMLKAVAIEHTKDVDAAVEFILKEVIPRIEAPQDLVTGEDDNHLSLCSPVAPHLSSQDIGNLSLDRFQEQSQLPDYQEAVEEANAGPSEVRYVAREHCDDSYHTSEAPDGSSTCLVEVKKDNSVSNHTSIKTKTNLEGGGSDSQGKYSKLVLAKEDDDGGLDEEEGEDENGETLCGACGENYTADEFWICCDVCEKWYHGKCVNIAPAHAEHIKYFKCPSCYSVRSSQEGNYPDQLSLNTETDPKHQENGLVGYQGSNVGSSDSQGKYSKLVLTKEDDDGGLDEEEDEDENGETLCGACGENYASDEFWICCDICEKWYHGKCVKITPARAEHIKHFKCPSCHSVRNSQEGNYPDQLSLNTETDPKHQENGLVGYQGSNVVSSSVMHDDAAISECNKTGFENDSILADLEDLSFPTTVETQSGQICRIDVLEDAISEAKNNKKTLFLSMESVINMMREVEDLEKAAEHAKEEAVKGGLDTLAKVEDIRKMLLHAKEANDMHAGEVYGEKAILATEARELQSRLLNLSYERDKSLAILNEMRQSLETRLAAAEDVRKAAEQDRLEKEGCARKALVEQELIMEKVVQESKRLQAEAEENSKLQEFLMDRGVVVDMLQGEIAVICKDVKLLKENFDDRVPFSKSLSSSQTSCILASSGSSGRSLTSSLVPEQVDTSQSPEATSTIPPFDDDSFEKSTLFEGAGYGGQNIVDDGWDLLV